MKALLALEDGRTFACRSFTGHGETGGEVVFNTSMSGYQEVLTDPSYRGQLVTMTYPLMGNYGINPEDMESDKIQVSAFLIREYQNYPNNFRSTATLADFLNSQHIMGIEALDTRAVTRHIRETGAMRALISTRDLDPDTLARRAGQIPSMTGQNLAKNVTTEAAYFWQDGKASFIDTDVRPLDRSIWRSSGGKHRVVVYDFGIKYNILRSLEALHCELMVVPAATDAGTLKALNPDGILLSNGPGDPEPVTDAIETIKKLLGHYPVFGICLGFQLLGLALGGKTFKLKFGHRGINQPVKNLSTGKVEITSQNHGFAVDPNSLDEKDITLTHINLNDNTLEGFRHRRLPVIAVQYHPEASPGPHDSRYLFNEFIRMLDR
ncbi:MAG: glutamine-hydrolyzing carbamoyl-phosphate synthase small subunit [Desulfobacterales bacterium]|nr:glutamine-hydrolyzing carbamoyl-phosphate synthase small subunit [Desulfobacterales bacterium]